MRAVLVLLIGFLAMVASSKERVTRALMDAPGGRAPIPAQEQITDPAARKLLDSPLSQDEVMSVLQQFQAGRITSEEADKMLGIAQSQPRNIAPPQSPAVEVAPGKFRPRQPWEF